MWVLTTQLCNICEPYSPTCPLLTTLLGIEEKTKIVRQMKTEWIEKTYNSNKDRLLKGILLERNQTEVPSMYDVMNALQDVLKNSGYASTNGDCPHRTLLLDKKRAPLINYWDWKEALYKNVLKIKPIENGTVIDHIASGHALDVLKVLGITGKEGFVVSVATNVLSRKYGRKDLAMFEDTFLTEEQKRLIALISPRATINVIKNKHVESKEDVMLPSTVEGLIKCYSICISSNPNSREPIKTKFLLKSFADKDGPIYGCYYCGRDVRKEEMLDRLIL